MYRTAKSLSVAENQTQFAFRAMFVSDLHLGARIAQAWMMRDSLNHTQGALYMVGDIIDGWRLFTHWDWQQEHEDVLQVAHMRANGGYPTVYIAGNHDDKLRAWMGKSGIGEDDFTHSIIYRGIRYQQQAVHTDLKGNRYLVLHGDQFDGFLKPDTAVMSALVHVADRLYDGMNWSNRMINKARMAMGLPYHSYSGAVKSAFKNAMARFVDKDGQIVSHLEQAGFDNMIYGHTHTTEDYVSASGKRILNDGDGVDSITALVENHDGEIRLVHLAPLCVEYQSRVRAGDAKAYEAFNPLARDHGARIVTANSRSPVLDFTVRAPLHEVLAGEAGAVARGGHRPVVSQYQDLLEMATFGPHDRAGASQGLGKAGVRRSRMADGVPSL